MSACVVLNWRDFNIDFNKLVYELKQKMVIAEKDFVWFLAQEDLIDADEPAQFKNISDAKDYTEKVFFDCKKELYNAAKDEWLDDDAFWNYFESLLVLHDLLCGNDYVQDYLLDDEIAKFSGDSYYGRGALDVYR